MMYLFIEGHVKKIGNILPPIYKKIANYRVFFGWFISLYSWLIIGSLIFANTKSILFSQIWVYSIFVLLLVYPCTISLAVYLQSFLYLRDSNDESSIKKNIVFSLIVTSVSLATPWILLLIFVLDLASIPSWVDSVIALAIYLAVFFVAIDLPYYQSMQTIKSKKIKGLNNVREMLVEKLCDEDRMDKRLAIEINIQRIDRDIEDIKSESSQPYSFLQSIPGFVIVSILAPLLVEILNIILKIK